VSGAGFIPRKISISWDNPPVKHGVSAYVHGDFAVHRIPDYPSKWSVTHLPTGLSTLNATGAFRRKKDACAAAVEIQRLRNSWRLTTAQDGFDPILREQVEEIGSRHGGDRVYRGWHGLGINPTLNGYAQSGEA
jgi:hypothetical protein